jgi:K+-transporting ATPase KdpF subunit
MSDAYNWVGLVIAVLVTIYLVAALLAPDKF